MLRKKILVLVVVFFCIVGLGLPLVSTAGQETVDGPFQPTWSSLMHHREAPDWFRDAKFGIYFHWGVYSVPAFGNEWYPRNMHRKGDKVYEHHIETYGDPAEFGYHDFIPMFKAEKFDAEEWAELFEKAGARYVGPVAEHHDGFSMWDSDLTPWNAANMGPKRDITGEIAKAARERGMKLVTSFHHARNSQHLINRDGKLQWTGHYVREEGWPTVLPELGLLYGNVPRDRFLELWKGKLFEVIDKYQPDLIWFDSWLNEIPATVQREFLVQYFNHAYQHGKEVVVTCKQRDMPLEVAVEDFEKGRADAMREDAWLTDDTISYGSWCYTENLQIKPLREVLHVLIDIVSKNGQLLLNVSPKADGSIPEDQQEVLLGIGNWLDEFGEAIYKTRPFLIYGEGPTKMEKGGHFLKTIEYQPQDIRYTRNQDTVYAIALGWPGPNESLTLSVFGDDGAAKDVTINEVKMLGSNRSIDWQKTADGLVLECPNRAPHVLAVVFAIETEGLPPQK